MLSNKIIDRLESCSRGESPRPVFVNSVCAFRRKFGECSHEFPEPAKFALNVRTRTWPGKTVRTIKSFLLTIDCIRVSRNSQRTGNESRFRSAFSTSQWLPAHIWRQNLL